MTLLMDDDPILAALAVALAPEPAEPSAEAMAVLHQALDALTRDNEDPVIVSFVPPPRRSTSTAVRRLRHPVAAVLAVAVLATSGVAAAGVATDHLPGPTRNVAYAIGLPVTSPSLEAAQGTLAVLSSALADHEATRIRASAAQLRTELAGLSPSDRARIQSEADLLLARAEGFLALSSTGGGRGPSGGSGPSGGASAGTRPLPGSTTGTGDDGDAGSGHGDSGSTTSKVAPVGGASAATPTTSADDGAGSTPGTTSPGTTRPGDDGGGTSDDPSGGGAVGGGNGAETTTTTPGTTTTTRPSGSDDGSDDGGGSDDGSDDGKGGRATPTTTRPASTTGAPSN